MLEELGVLPRRKYATGQEIFEHCRLIARTFDLTRDTCFHTGVTAIRWDYAYTGGGPDGGLTGLADKVVGIVGTGATAVQCIPHLAARARQLGLDVDNPCDLAPLADFRKMEAIRARVDAVVEDFGRE